MKWFIRLGSNITAKNKFLLYSGTLLLLIIAVMSVQSISMYSSLASDKVNKALEQQMQYASRSVDMEIGSYARVLLTMYIDKSLHKIITDSDSAGYNLKFDFLQDKVNNLNNYIYGLLSGLERRPEFRLYLDSDLQPYDVSFGNISYTAAVAGEPWFNRVAGPRKYSLAWDVTEQLDEPTGESRMILGATLGIRDFFSDSRRRIALARLEQDMRWLDGPLSKALDLKNGVLYILDGEGRPIYASDRDPVPAAALQGELKKAGWAPGSSGFLRTDGENGDRIAFYHYNARMGWNLVYLTDQTIFSGSFYTIGRFILSFVLPLILLSLLLLVVSSKFLTDRLVMLKTAVEKIDENHLGLDAPLAGGDEVGVLADSFRKVLGMVRNLLEKNRAIERDKYLTELQTLQERANPHFLYNTLSLISAMAMDIEAYSISEALASMADFYRMSLGHGDDIVTVGEELKMLDLYVNACRMRFGDRIRIRIDVPGDLKGCYTPKLILQPFVENAVIHGLRVDPEREAHIDIAGRSEDGRIIFEIADDGVGMDEATLRNIALQQQADDSYHAIKNTNKRIQLHFGENYGVSIRSGAGVGTTVTISIPLMREHPKPGAVTAEARRGETGD